MRLNEGTYISLGLVAILIGGVVWLTALWSNTEANASDIQELKSNHQMFSRDVGDIKKSVYRIEGFLGTLPKDLDYDQ